MKPKGFTPISKRSKDRIKKHLRESPELFCIYSLLSEMNLAGYLIGGTVRDLILNRPIKDIDIAINTNPEHFLKKLSSKIKGYTICLDQEYLIFRFITKDRLTFDISPLKGDCLLQDLPQRDFTINAIAIDLKELFTQATTLTIIDPLEGVGDMTKKIIRAISDRIFLDDPLRILRAYRLAGQLNYRIEAQTEVFISRDKELLKKAASERIREELFALFSLDYCSSYIEQLYQNGLFPILFLQRLPKELLPKIPKKTWLRSLQMLTSVEKILTDLLYSSSASFKDLNQLLGQIAGHQTTYKPLLKLAALLSVFFQLMENEKMTTPGAVKSVTNKRITKTHLPWVDFLLRSLCLTTPQRKYIVNCLQGYQEPLYFIHKGRCTPKYFYRFFRDFGQAGMGALILSIAEQQVLKASPSAITALNDLFAAMANFYFSWQTIQNNPIVDGEFLMNYFHLSPGPLIGDLLDFLKESQAEGKVTNKDEAIHLAEHYLKDIQK